MRGLKALVISLGILIVAGMAVVAVTVANRIGDRAEPARPAAPAATAGTPFGRAEVAIPKGARVVETAVSGGRLVVRLELAGGATRLLVLDPDTGRAAGAVDLVPSE
jgi:hypothetical protein